MYFNKHSFVQEALENYEVKKNADQTSKKNKFEVFDTKSSTSTNNDPGDPQKKEKKKEKKKKTMVISQQ